MTIFGLVFGWLFRHRAARRRGGLLPPAVFEGIREDAWDRANREALGR